eukprot:675008-Heterocapsa_arctica.AAC.1
MSSASSPPSLNASRVEFVQAVLGPAEDLPGRTVAHHQGAVVDVLLLAQLGHLRDVLVQRCDVGGQDGDLLGRLRDGLLGRSDGGVP